MPCFFQLQRAHGFSSFSNSLFDLLTDKVQRITDSECYMAGVSSDGEYLIYAAENKADRQNKQTKIYWRELDSGKDELAATLPGLILHGRLLISPSGNRVVIGATVIEKNGAMRKFPSGWTAFGWADDNKVGLIGSRRSPIPLALGNVETMQMRNINP